MSSKCKAKKLAMLCFLSLVSEIVLLDCFRAVECMSARRTKQGLLTTKSSYVEEKDGVVKLCCCMPACLLGCCRLTMGAFRATIIRLRSDGFLSIACWAGTEPVARQSELEQRL